MCVIDTQKSLRDILSFRSILKCKNCSTSKIDFSQFDDSNPKELKGHIACMTCGWQGSFDNGVLIARREDRSDFSKNENRNDKAYTDLWNRGHDFYKDQTYSRENQELAKWSSYFKTDSVMDVGCGSGRHLEKWLEFGAKSLVLVDISDAIFQARREFLLLNSSIPALFIKASMNQLPLKTQSISFTWSSGTLGLAEDQEGALKEMLRLTRKNLVLGVLTEKTFLGKVFIFANIFKPMINRADNFDLLFRLSGFSARLILFTLRIAHALKLSRLFLDLEIVERILNDKNAVKRLKYSLYDPIVVPNVKKYPDQFYIDIAAQSGFDLKGQSTTFNCDFYEFSQKIHELPR